MAGGLARLTTQQLLRDYPDCKIYGVDSRYIPPENVYNERVETRRIRYTRGHFEALFREHQFDTVLHLGRMSHNRLNPRASLDKRLDYNVMGSKIIMDLVIKFSIKNFIILSTYHVYGAYPDNPVFIDEEASLRASLKYPELRDVVEMDQQASNWLWKHQQKVKGVIFRPCNIIGPQINNVMVRYLKSKWAPLPLDFDPVFQFINEYDMARLISFAITNIPTGIYNVANGNDTMPLREAKYLVEKRHIPVVLSAVIPFVKMMNYSPWSVPDYLLDYLKYSCILGSENLMRHLPDNFFKYNTEQSLKSLKN